MARDRAKRRNLVGPVLLIALVGLFIACGEGAQYRPQGNAIGEPRHQQFTDLVAHARTLPAGRYPAAEFPKQFHSLNILSVHCSEKAWAIEFPSSTPDSNPIYVFVDDIVSDAEALVREWCSRQPSWKFARPLDEKGWYYVHGP